MTEIICLILGIAFWALLIWVILGYVVHFGRLPYDHPVRRVFDALERGIRPVLAPIRNVLPPLRFGGVALDLSALVIFLLIGVLRSAIC